MVKPWSHYRWSGGFWFRLFGWGLWFADYASNPPRFSEREGLVRPFFRTRSWRVRLLRP